MNEWWRQNGFEVDFPDLSLPWALVRVDLTPGGITQNIERTFGRPDEADRRLTDRKKCKPFLCDFYIAFNDEKLRKELAKPVTATRRR